MTRVIFGQSRRVIAVFAVAFGAVQALVGQNLAAKPEIVVQSGHTFGLQAVTFSADGRWFASAGWDGNVKVWDTANGTEVETFSARTAFSAVALSQDGHLVAATGGDKAVHVWDLVSSTEKFLLRGQTDGAIGFALNGKVLVGGSKEDSHKTVWDMSDGRELGSFSGKEFAISADSTLLAINSTDTDIDIYDLHSRKSVKHLLIAGAPVSFNRTGDHLAVRGPDSIHIWNLETSVDERAVGSFASGSPPLAMAFDKDWQHIASGGQDNAVTLWSVATGERLWKSPAYAGPVAGVPVHVIASLSFDPNGASLISANWDNTITFWDVATGRTQRLIRHRTDSPATIAVSPDGRWLAFPGNGQASTLWDLAGDSGSRKLSGSVSVFGFSPDSREVLVYGTAGTLSLKNVQTGKDTVKFVEPDRVVSAALSSDAGLLATTTATRGVHVWDVKSGTEKPRLQLQDRAGLGRVGLGPPPRVLGFSEGATLVVFDQMEAEVIFWSITDSRRLAPVKGLERAGSAVLSLDGVWLALGDLIESRIGSECITFKQRLFGKSKESDQ